MLFAGDWQQMPGVAAPFISADMVQIFTLGFGTDQGLVDGDMSHHWLPVTLMNLSISIRRNMSRPVPANIAIGSLGDRVELVL
jgi:hypothetical protein